MIFGIQKAIKKAIKIALKTTTLTSHLHPVGLHESNVLKQDFFFKQTEKNGKFRPMG